jgi:hypothetical protein
VGAGLGVAGSRLFPGDAWSRGKTEALTWNRAEVDRTARTALVGYTGGYCSRFDHAETATNARCFVITVFERMRRLGKKEGCPLIGVPRTVRVSFFEAIGTRSVVDGACSRSGTRDVVCQTSEPAPPCVLIDAATDCSPSERLGPEGRLLRPLTIGLDRP